MNIKDSVLSGNSHYESVPMSAITKVEVGDEVSVKVVHQSRLVDWILELSFDDCGAIFTGFKL